MMQKVTNAAPAAHLRTGSHSTGGGDCGAQWRSRKYKNSWKCNTHSTHNTTTTIRG